MVKLNPFIDLPIDTEAKHYATFLVEKPKNKRELPLTSPKDGIEVFRDLRLDLFSVSCKMNTRCGFPNKFIENN